MTRLQGGKELGRFKALRGSQMRYNVMGWESLLCPPLLGFVDLIVKVGFSLSIVMVNVMFLEQCHHSWVLNEGQIQGAGS